jgi:hypothetical protein
MGIVGLSDSHLWCELQPRRIGRIHRSRPFTDPILRFLPSSVFQRFPPRLCGEDSHIPFTTLLSSITSIHSGHSGQTCLRRSAPLGAPSGKCRVKGARERFLAPQARAQRSGAHKSYQTCKRCIIDGMAWRLNSANPNRAAISYEAPFATQRAERLKRQTRTRRAGI